MRKYLTRRCIGLHALVLVLVPAFLYAGWWQYHVALSGNELSWVYTIEWPFFAVYAVYIWWKLIHDESTLFDRLWAARQRIAADAEGRPLHEIPGWAMDKALSKEVRQASSDAARHRALSGPRLDVLDMPARGPANLLPKVSGVADAEPERSTSPLQSPRHGNADLDGRNTDLDDSAGGMVIDARVLEVTTHVDEELEAYNRYLFELSRNGPAKRWGSRGSKRHGGPPEAHETSGSVPALRQRPALPPTNEHN